MMLTVLQEWTSTIGGILLSFSLLTAATQAERVEHYLDADPHSVSAVVIKREVPRPDEVLIRVDRTSVKALVTDGNEGITQKARDGDISVARA